MKWSNLKQNKCPKCNKVFQVFTGVQIKCPCGFVISVAKFEQIVNDQVGRAVNRMHQEDENQEALSNL